MNFELKWIVEFFLVSKCERVNHLLKATNQLTGAGKIIYKGGRGFELGTAVKQLQLSNGQN